MQVWLVRLHQLKFNKMNRTKDELLLECIKQFEHIENVLGYNRLATTRSLINEINQALTIPAIVGESEQLKPEPQICYKSNEPCKYNCSGLCKESY
jgi:hypothetical protein